MKAHLLLPSACLALVVLAGCTCRSPSARTSDTDTDPSVSNAFQSRENSGEPVWYYFSEAGIHYAQNPSEIPPRAFVPWTEAIRAVDAAVLNGAPALLINKLGIMSTVTGTPTLHTDGGLFSSHTAGGMYRTGESLSVRLYRNALFSADAASGNNAGTGNTADASPGIFLADFNPASGSFTAALASSDLGLPAEAQCVALDRIGSMWYASFKYDTPQKVEFMYLEFESFPVKKGDSGAYDLSGIRKIDNSAYQQSVSPFPYRNAPDQIKQALSVLPEDTALNLRVYSSATNSAQKYTRGGSGTPVDGSAYVSDDRIAILFADGTFFITSGKPGANTPGADTASSANIVLKLPALAAGYVYTDFILSGQTLIAAWEEQRFFETGRAGLLEIPLKDAVY